MLIVFCYLQTACTTPPPAPPTTPAPTATNSGLEVAAFATATTVVNQVPDFPTFTPTTTPLPTPTATRVIPTTPTLSTDGPRAPDQNPLTGLTVDDSALLQRRPVMVRLGNDPAARPQIALNDADLVYEELVEWFITRFTAVYLTNDPELAGPIRSARLINTQLVPQYQAAFAHSGGSDSVRFELSQLDIVNLDEFFVPDPYIYRANASWQTRLAVDVTAVRQYLANEALELDPQLRGFAFADELSVANGEAVEINIPYPAASGSVTWLYDPIIEQYRRKGFTDSVGEAVTAANVIIYFAQHSNTNIVEDANGATSVRIALNGRGEAWLMRDGKFVQGNWQTDGQQTPQFLFDNGQPMPLKPGQSWIQVVPLDYQIAIDGQSYGLEP